MGLALRILRIMRIIVGMMRINPFSGIMRILRIVRIMRILATIYEKIGIKMDIEPPQKKRDFELGIGL